jgi:hypothetical protein
MSKSRRRRKQHGRKKADIAKRSNPPVVSHQAREEVVRSTRAESGGIQLLKTRRAFLRAISEVTLAVAGGALGNILAMEWGRREEPRDQVAYFFLLFETDQFSQAYQVGLDIVSQFAAGGTELSRWLNNLACVAAWEGEFENARQLLLRGQDIAHSWRAAIIQCNLAYVEYHLGGSTRGRIRQIQRIVRSPLSNAVIREEGWLQMWSRQPKLSMRWTPPFGVLLRLYAKEGNYRAAYESGEADIRQQGHRAQGSRVLLGWIAQVTHSERVSLQYVDEIAEEYNPPTSWDHMRTVRGLIVANLTNNRLPEDESFLGQAMSPKGRYHSWAGLADLKYFLAAEISWPLRYEYGRKLLAGYQEAGRGDDYSVRQMAALVR